MDLKSSIHPAALDLMFGSATNAGQKGQSQYSTPVNLARQLALNMIGYRPAMVDLTCGPGHLLAGCAHKSTEHLIGCEIAPSGKFPPTPNPNLRHSVIQADLTLLYAAMKQIDFRADCFALNPPWSLHWHAERLEGLADSEVPAVAKSFKAHFMHGPGGGEVSIDSTLATLMIALDRLSRCGEGMLIGYSSTLERLIFTPGAVGAPLAEHIWKKISCTEASKGNEENSTSLPSLPSVKSSNPFDSATAIYFSASHHDGPTADGRRPRFLPQLHPYGTRSDTWGQWRALEDRAQAMLPDAPPRYHLSLAGHDIQVRLSLFDSALVKVNRALGATAQRLHELDGRNPMQVVMQRDERNFILGLLKPGAEWTVDPALKAALEKAIIEYNSIRAPLVPLPEIQRLGYLDEADSILCLKDLAMGGASIFRAGVSYPLATRSLRFTRTKMKPNMQGEDEELELSGQELAILIDSNPRERSERAEAGQSSRSLSDSEFCFMDVGLRESDVTIDQTIHFTLQELVDHFEIPSVPDIASNDPIRYQTFVEQLRQLESL